MPRTVAIGEEFFETLRVKNLFYIDKTDFIRQWWDSGTKVTAIMRPRRFGKTLTMDMAECFFSVKYAGRSELFEGLSIWEEERFRALQGMYPVLFLSFAEVKNTTFEVARRNICGLVQKLYEKNRFLLKGNLLTENEKAFFEEISKNMADDVAAESLLCLMDYLSRYYGKKVIVLLDEYDTPLQEAYVKGYWEQLVAFLRPLFGTTFKGNPYLERGLMTGITRVAKESIFSDLNNLDVVTTTSDKYAGCFGFTQQEVDAALEEFGLSGKRAKVKKMYDGFTFGRQKNIYNPWSITKFLAEGKIEAYWSNTSGNALAGSLVRLGSMEVKDDFVSLMEGKPIEKAVNEEISFNQLDQRDDAVWSILLAAGYLKAVHVRKDKAAGKKYYRLALTNGEVQELFQGIITGWFTDLDMPGDKFVLALLRDDLEMMNRTMNELTEGLISSFDVPGKSEKTEKQPEMFYHAFVLGLVAFLRGRFVIESNRESGDGRYDLQMTPKRPGKDHPILIEFKVRDRKTEKGLSRTVEKALKQIEEKNYVQDLVSHGFDEGQIRKYGFAFDGKKVLIGC